MLGSPSNDSGSDCTASPSTSGVGGGYPGVSSGDKRTARSRFREKSIFSLEFQKANKSLADQKMYQEEFETGEVNLVPEHVNDMMN